MKIFYTRKELELEISKALMEQQVRRDQEDVLRELHRRLDQLQERIWDLENPARFSNCDCKDQGD